MLLRLSRRGEKKVSEIVDGRGRPCPQPVIMTKKVLEKEPSKVKVLVDNQVACQNVTRLAEKMGYEVEITEKESEFSLYLSKGEKREREVLTSTSTVFLITSEVLGRGGDELGKVLSRAFFPTLTETASRPRSLIFINTGVRLVVEDSPVLDSLRSLVDLGVEILACGTCLDYFGLKDKVAVGTVSNMYDIVETLTTADKVISL